MAKPKYETLRNKIAETENEISIFGKMIEEYTANILNGKKEFKEEFGVEFDSYKFSLHSADDIDKKARNISFIIGSRARQEKYVKEYTKKLAKLSAELATYSEEIKKDEELFNNLPTALKEMASDITKKWDEYDFEHKNDDRNNWTYMKSNAYIHNVNAYNAKLDVFKLYKRVIDITGEITDFNVSYNLENLNGIVTGEKGTARVFSDYAGGYNIQRLHVRTYVKPVKRVA